MAAAPRLISGDSSPRRLICLVRHGESTWIAEGRFQGQADPPLSPLGMRQSELLARGLAPRLAEMGFRSTDRPLTVFHSPLARAAGTAGAVASALGPTTGLRPHAGLMELSQGDWQGLTHTEVEEGWPRELAAWRRNPLQAHAPGGESLTEGDVRVRAALRDLLPDHASPIAVAHDGVLRLALLALLDLPIDRFWSFPFPLAGYSTIEVDAGSAQLLAHGIVDHLQGGAGPGRAGAAVDRGGAL